MNAVLPYGEQAIECCHSVLVGLTARDLDRRTPCAEFTVRDVGDHLQRSMVLLGGVAGTELSADPDAALAQSIADLAGGAVLAWRQRGTEGEVAVGRTITPARLAAEIVTLELVVHAWDIAQATGRDLAAAPELCEHTLTQAQQLITADKRGRSFAPAVAIGPDAAALDRLVAFTGRLARI